MKVFNLCSPALIYLIFSITQVVVDTIKGFYNVALLKFTMMILFTLLLNILCERGLGVISWIIVFVPFILMSVITSILLFVFGLDPSSGKIIPPQSMHTIDDRRIRETPTPHVSVTNIKKQQPITPQKANHNSDVSEREQYLIHALEKNEYEHYHK